MKLDTAAREPARLLCDHIAMTRMIDRPDGPFATAIRSLGRRTEFNEAETSQLRGLAAGQVALYGNTLAEGARQQTLLTALALVSTNPQGALAEVGQIFPPHPEATATEAASFILALTEKMPEA